MIQPIKILLVSTTGYKKTVQSVGRELSIFFTFEILNKLTIHEIVNKDIFYYYKWHLQVYTAVLHKIYVICQGTMTCSSIKLFCA